MTENRRAESEIQGLAKLNHIGEKIADIEDILRTRTT
jgi:hypothetical protein